jgi:1,4-alpha-glucan branching enzyme
MTETPLLVENDPWLKPHEEAIQRRIARFHEALADVNQRTGSLSSYATGHQYIGIHFHPKTRTWTVREWAPQAKAVYLIGDFNGWNRESHPLVLDNGGVWQLKLPETALSHGQRVKLHIIGADHSRRDRIPACIRRAVQEQGTNDYSGQIWSPSEAYPWRHEFDPASIRTPFIYEAHVGMAGEEGRVHTYREFADHIIPRIKDCGYNTIQLMAIQEHPYYGSFGYHVSSFFAPSSRFGTPDDLKYLVDTAHGAGLAVLLDLVHSHAVKNVAEGLNDFDGSGSLYFHSGERGDHSQWDSKCFDYGRPEVRQFLLSNVRWWLEEFRFDGFRFDGVTSMLYHSHGNKAFTTYDDYFGSDVEEDAIVYFQLATTLCHRLKPGAMIVAEDMSGMPGLCRPVEEGGIGFTHRLGMGLPDYWIKLLKEVPDEQWDLGAIWGVMTNRRTGEATIAYAESHDQALVGDKTLAFRLMDQEMYWHMGKGDSDPVIERGIALHKIIRLVTLAFGGEGWLNFMGNEFGHPEWVDFPREGNGWSYQHCRRQWSLGDNPDLKYEWLGAFDRTLVQWATESGVLGAPEASLLNIDASNQVLCAERGGFVFVINLSVDRSLPDYELPVKEGGDYRLVLDTDATEFGGQGRLDRRIVYPVNAEGKLTVYTPARTALVFERQ